MRDRQSTRGPRIRLRFLSPARMLRAEHAAWLAQPVPVPVTMRGLAVLVVVLTLVASAGQTRSAEVDAATNSIGMRLIRIPAGKYVRGAIHGDQLRKNHPFSTGATGAHDARPAHRVEISRAFSIGATEVTVAQFGTFVQATSYRTSAERSGKGALRFIAGAAAGIARFQCKSTCNWRAPGFPQQDSSPVTCVSWQDAQAFCRWLSSRERKTYRLPTEAEWEYAARAGSTTSYLGGNDPGSAYTYGNVADAALESAHPGMTRRQRIAGLDGPGDGFAMTAPVGSFRANAWGLYDTQGNVWEWCSDKYHPGYYSELTGVTVMHNDPDRLPLIVDPRGPEQTLHEEFGDWRAIRGGAWCTSPITSRSASRSFAEAEDAACYTGFRVVCEMPAK